MTRTVWAYWEGPRPAYVELCHEIMAICNGPQFRLIGENDLPELLPAHQWIWGDAYFNSSLPAHKADIIRVKLLEKYGGCWIDSDFIQLNSFGPLFAVMERGAFLYYKDGHRPTNGIIFSLPGESVITEWSRKIDCVFTNLRRHGRKLSGTNGWTSYGGDQLEVVLANAIQPTYDLGWDRVQLVPYREMKRFFETANIRDRVWFGCYGYMLFNNGLRFLHPEFWKADRETILNGPWMISLLFRVALGLEARH